MPFISGAEVNSAFNPRLSERLLALPTCLNGDHARLRSSGNGSCWHVYLAYTAVLKYRFMTSVNQNVGTTERLISLLGGAYLLYQTLTERKPNAMQTLAGTYLLLRGATGICLAYRGLGKTNVDYKAQNVNIRSALTVHRPRHHVYAAWRRLENLPQFMTHLRSVEVLDEKTSEWTATGPGNVGALSWRSEIVKDDPGAMLSWQSLPGSSIENAGKVTFEDSGESTTELNVVISYRAPLGLLGEAAGRWINPLFENMIKEDISNFKQYIETGKTNYELRMTRDE